jgi:hypothetical protein
LFGDRPRRPPDALAVQIVVIDQGTVNIVNADGAFGRSTRC